MKIITSLIALLFIATNVQAADWKWSTTLGMGIVEWEEDLVYVSDGEATGATNSTDVGYNPGIYGFGVTDGTHAFTYKLTSAGKDDISSTYIDTDGVELVSGVDGYTEDSYTSNHKETSLSYQYKFPNSGWSLGAAYNKIEQEINLVETNVNQGSLSYQWGSSFKSDRELDGFAVYTTWQTQIAPTWFAAVKLGVAQADASQPTSYSTRLSGVSAELDEVYTNFFGAPVNGSGFDTAYDQDGSSTYGIFGFSIVKIFPESPAHQLIFSFDTREDTIDGDVSNKTETPVGFYATEAWLAGEPDSALAQEELISKNSDATNWKFAAEWKYTF